METNLISPEPETRAALRLASQVVSSLPLQMTLYFNLIYFPCWLAVILMVATVKFSLLNYLYKFVLVTILVAVIIIEVVRLYLGYLGNLGEKVPELAGFWLLTILLQLPMQAFLLFNTDLILVPVEKAAGSVMLVLVVAELLSPGLVGFNNPAFVPEEDENFKKSQ